MYHDSIRIRACGALPSGALEGKAGICNSSVWPSWTSFTGHGHKDLVLNPSLTDIIRSM